MLDKNTWTENVGGLVCEGGRIWDTTVLVFIVLSCASRDGRSQHPFIFVHTVAHYEVRPTQDSIESVIPMAIAGR